MYVCQNANFGEIGVDGTMAEKWKILDDCLKQMQILDLSPVLEPGMPKWPTHPPVIIDPTATHAHDGYYCQTLSFGEHTGAHVDAPAHMVDSMIDHTIDKYPANMIFGCAIKYDVYKFAVPFGERVTKDQILELEQEMGDNAGAGEIPIFNFGHQKYWSTGRDWDYSVTNEAGLDEETVQMFLDRGIKAAGFDTAGGDQPLKDGKEKFAYGHRKLWLPNEIFIIENLHNLDLLPQRFYFIALPLRIKNGSGSPIRPVAYF